MLASNSRFNFYEVLELNTNSAQHEITTAYERARATYSGENPAIYTIFSEQEARELLTLIEEAYSILGNKTLRNIYDQRLLGNNKSNPEDLTYESILSASRLIFNEAKGENKKIVYVRDEAFEKEIAEQTQWTGVFLKKVREYKKYPIERLSDVIKVNPFYIKAIELEEPTNLPAPVFVRGYVMQISKELGLDAKTVADSYMKRFNK
ncbi:MAG: helix-turn-helix domain-containing protein [Bdellovibrionaceae bacterium]|nr:helix-turn-helix domain-containing protein [Pseudobdellovibrionaceae bacterium]NUM58087.1 helix-turn-helix domain-containing protein [Pseudobdellovibrionaceae bacterium]